MGWRSPLRCPLIPVLLWALIHATPAHGLCAADGAQGGQFGTAAVASDIVAAGLAGDWAACGGGLHLLQSYVGRRNASAGGSVMPPVVQAALGADGMAEIRLQAPHFGAPMLTGLAVGNKPGSLPPAAGPSAAGLWDGRALRAPGAAETVHAAALATRASLRLANEQLRKENERLRLVGESLRQGNVVLRQEDASLRTVDTELRVEDAKLRRALDTASASKDYPLPFGADNYDYWAVGAANPRAPKPRKKLIIWASVLVSLTLVAFVAIHLLLRWNLREDDGMSSDEESEEKRIISELKYMNERNRMCPHCWCCCSPGVLFFLTLMLVVSVLAGCILWEMGILQPILAQFVTYAYVIALFAAFVAILIWEFWQMFRTFVRYIVTQLETLKSVLRPFRRVARHGDLFAN